MENVRTYLNVVSRRLDPFRRSIIETEHIQNVDKMGLFWRKMPACMYLAKEESDTLKLSKNRLTLLLGANLAGDWS